MKVQVISDTHFGHQKLVDEGKRTAGYESAIRQSVIRECTGAVVIHLGDVSIGNDRDGHESFLAACADAGCRRTILVRGNHDKGASWCLDRGWDAVVDTLSLKMFGHRILLTHRPATVGLLHFGDYTLNVHGHLHDREHRGYDAEEFSWRHHLISLERDGYRTFSLQKICRDHDDKLAFREQYEINRVRPWGDTGPHPA